jgi:hypothetical protein
VNYRTIHAREGYLEASGISEIQPVCIPSDISSYASEENVYCYFYFVVAAEL